MAGRRLILLLTAFSVLQVEAQVISQSLAFRLNSDAPSATLSFLPFDPSLGILQAVQIAFVATRQHDFAIWNGLSDSSVIAYEASLQGTSATFGGNFYAFPDLSYGPATTSVLAPISILDFATEFLAGRAQFLSGADPVFPSAFQSSVSSSVSGGFARPLSFDGSLAISFDPGVWSIAADNFYSASFVDVAGTMTATYRFVPVPESSAMGLAAAGLLLTAVVIRFRSRKPVR